MALHGIDSICRCPITRVPRLGNLLKQCAHFKPLCIRQTVGSLNFQQQFPTHRKALVYSKGILI